MRLKFFYNEELNCIIVARKKERIYLYVPALKAHCEKYGIIMKTYNDLYRYLVSPKCYIPKEVFGYN